MSLTHALAPGQLWVLRLSPLKFDPVKRVMPKARLASQASQKLVTGRRRSAKSASVVRDRKFMLILRTLVVI